VAGHLAELPAGSLLVVRANPAGASSPERLGADLSSALKSLTGPVPT
jgi:hypothetical protein